MASLNRAALNDAASFNGDAVMHIAGSDRNAFKGFDGIKLGARAHQTAGAPQKKLGMGLTNG